MATDTNKNVITTNEGNNGQVAEAEEIANSKT